MCHRHRRLKPRRWLNPGLDLNLKLGSLDAVVDIPGNLIGHPLRLGDLLLGERAAAVDDLVDYVVVDKVEGVADVKSADVDSAGDTPAVEDVPAPPFSDPADEFGDGSVGRPVYCSITQRMMSMTCV